MVKKALLVGINYYNTANALQGCIDDIVNMRNALIDAYSYSANNIIMLRDDISSTAATATLPTRSNILAQLAALVQQSSQLEEMWVHYSGHGSYVKDKNGDEIASGRDSTIVPCDFLKSGFIVDDELLALLKRVHPSCRVILLFDSCFSGSVCDLPWSFEFLSGNTFSRSLVDRVTLAHPHMYMMSGCKDNQTSAEVYVAANKQYRGAFTHAFLECLRASGHNTSILALYKAVCLFLAGQQQQKPLLSSSNVLPSAMLVKAGAAATAAGASTASGANTAPGKKMLMCF
jgi:hypothetical protein